MCSERLALPMPCRRSALAKLSSPNVSLLAAMAIKKETWHRDIISPARFSSEVPSFGYPTQDSESAGTEQLPIHSFVPVDTEDKTILVEHPRLLSNPSQCLGHPQEETLEERMKGQHFLQFLTRRVFMELKRFDAIDFSRLDALEVRRGANPQAV